MQKNTTILHECSPEQIQSMFAGIEAQLKEIKDKFEPKEPNKYLTRSELADLLKCDLSTIHNWCKKGKLKAYGIGNRVYFLRSEVESSIQIIN